MAAFDKKNLSKGFLVDIGEKIAQVGNTAKTITQAVDTLNKSFGSLIGAFSNQQIDSNQQTFTQKDLKNKKGKIKNVGTKKT